MNSRARYMTLPLHLRLRMHLCCRLDIRCLVSRNEWLSIYRLEL